METSRKEDGLGLTGGTRYGHAPATFSRHPNARHDATAGGNAPRKKAGRPKGPPSTIINLRLPLTLLARLDRYIDRLESHTGLKAHRGMLARRALELFLETHEAS